MTSQSIWNNTQAPHHDLQSPRGLVLEGLSILSWFQSPFCPPGSSFLLLLGNNQLVLLFANAVPYKEILPSLFFMAASCSLLHFRLTCQLHRRKPCYHFIQVGFPTMLFLSLSYAHCKTGSFQTWIKYSTFTSLTFLCRIKIRLLSYPSRPEICKVWINSHTDLLSYLLPVCHVGASVWHNNKWVFHSI